MVNFITNIFFCKLRNFSLYVYIFEYIKPYIIATKSNISRDKPNRNESNFISS